MNIDTFIKSNQFTILTGHIGPVQKQQFIDRLSLYPQIQKVAEIGFNAGHSAECFLEHCKNLNGFVTFDLNIYPYTKPAANHLHTLYPNQFLFIEGDSRIKMPEFTQLFPKQKFDLIFIDGNHDFDYVFADILNAKELAHENTILWLDDYHFSGVRQALTLCESLSLLKVQELFPFEMPLGSGSWVEARYI